MSRVSIFGAQRLKATSSWPIAPGRTAPSSRLSPPSRDKIFLAENSRIRPARRHTLTQKHLFHFEPIVNSLVVRHSGVVGRTVQYSLALEAPQLPRIVINQI